MADPVTPSTTTLPDADWRHAPALLRIIDLLGGVADTRAVGGAVRDTLAGLAVSDIDLATRLEPQAVMRRLEGSGYKIVPTGIAHGTLTVVADGQPYEVTTLRRDVSTDGRRATVAFSTDWQEDAARRDFTFNALYADPVSGALFDLTDGAADLAAGRVRFIGDAAQRIDEDHLRIMRWFRFQARFGRNGPDAATLEVIAAKAKTLRSLSRERVADELLRILALPDPVPTLQLMAQTGVTAEIMPEAGEDAPARVARLVAREATAGLPTDGARRLLAMLPQDVASADGVAARLKLSNRLRKRIATALGTADEPADAAHIRALAYGIGKEGAIDRLLLDAGEDVVAVCAQLDGWEAPKLPIGGRDIVDAGIGVGPDVARILRSVERQWIAEGFPDDTRTRTILRDMLTAG